MNGSLGIGNILSQVIESILSGRALRCRVGSSQILWIWQATSSRAPRHQARGGVSGVHPWHDTKPYLVRPLLYEPLVKTVTNFDNVGVALFGIHENGILFSHPEALERAVIVDLVVRVRGGKKHQTRSGTALGMPTWVI